MLPYLLALLSLLSSSRALRVLHLSRHHGTVCDVQYLLNHFGVYNISIFDPSVYFRPFGMTVAESERVLASPEAGPALSRLARSHDLIIVSDTIPDSLPVLMLKRRDPSAVRAQVVLLVTNRFDYTNRHRGYFASREYIRFMREASSLPGVHWVVNNPWEAQYMHLRGLGVDPAALVRPLGFSDTPARDVPPGSDEQCVYLERTKFDRRVLAPALRKHGIRLVRLAGQYGGPRTLARYKCFVFVPYQASTMKLPENLAYGVVTLIPTEPFMKRLLRQHGSLLASLRPVMDSDGDRGLARFCEYYHPRHRGLFYHFDSWEHLGLLADLPKAMLDTQRVVSRGRAFIDQDRRQQVAAALRFLQTIGLPLDLQQPPEPPNGSGPP